ncbi:unnamed protein product [Phaeothamnion confervicola]
MKKEAGTDVDIADRLLSTLPYALPFLDGVDYGRYIYALAPGLGEAVYSVFGSTIALWKGTPLVAFGAFIGLTFLARNQSLPRFVRFNVQQAILLDIGLIICNLFEVRFTGRQVGKNVFFSLFSSGSPTLRLRGPSGRFRREARSRSPTSSSCASPLPSHTASSRTPRAR